MALSSKAKKRVEVAMARRVEAKEVTDAIDANTAAVVSLSGSTAGGTLTNAHLLVGSAANVATSVAVSGEASIVASGAVTLSNAAVIAKVLTGFSSGAGTVGATDSILAAVQKVNGNQALDAAAIVLLKNGTPSLTGQTELTVSGALDTTSGESTFSNTDVGPYAVTLAAPSSQDGQLKVLKAVATMTSPVTLAMTNIVSYPGGANTTLTFTNAGDCAILMAVGAKWIMVGGSAVAS